MSYRSLFDATMTTEPPPRTTVDTVIAQARRRLRIQRFAATAGGLAVVAVATAGGFAVASGPAPSLGPAAVAPVTPSPTLPAPAPSTLRGVEPTETAAHAVARLESAIPRAIRDAVPGVHLDGPVTVKRRNVPSSPTGDGGTYPARFFYETEAQTIQVAGKRAVISVSLERLFVDSFCEPRGEDSRAQALLPSPDPAPEVSCAVTDGPNGERVVTTTIVEESAGLVRIDLRVDEPDGSTVSVYLESQAGAVLTAEQMVAIAVDPRVTFYR